MSRNNADLFDRDADRFFRSYTEEPHRSRRNEIIKAHPEVLKLCGPEPLTKYLVLGVVILQISVAYVLRNRSVVSWPFLFTTYFIGATANHNLMLAIHEISHNLAFKSPTANRFFAVFANLPIGFPLSAYFRPYHLAHHKSLGIEGLDVDIPTVLETILLDSIIGKCIFCTFQLFFYAIRPATIYSIPFTALSLFNIFTQTVFDVIVYTYLGGNSLVYLLVSSWLAGSLHPCSGHFIAEHYVFQQHLPTVDDVTTGSNTIPETFSYYGPLNLLTYNVGLHNEHHDFPAIPWTRLPRLHEIAKEFYQDLPSHSSWTLVIWQFIWDKDAGLACRVKREATSKHTSR